MLASAMLTSVFSFATTSAGSFAGPHKPYQLWNS